MTSSHKGMRGGKTVFDHSKAFTRSIGWLTSDELDALRGKRVAIAGLGGVGGSHLLTLTRLGVGGFAISDLDCFELQNFNRQVGATMSTLGRPKIDCLAEMALEINPDLSLARFPEGVNDANLDSFLRDADVYVDGIDFFATSTRRALFSACSAHGIPAITAAPLGWGVSLLAFAPGGMTFEEYFQFEGKSELDQLRQFLVGLSPDALQLGALMDATRFDLEQRVGPSTPVGCELCAALAATTAIKFLLGRGPIDTAPVSLHFDAYSSSLRTISRPGGMNHPAMREALARMQW